MSCLICNSGKIHHIYDLYDDRYGYPGIFRVVNCDVCEHYFIENNLKSYELVELYSNYYPRSSFDIEKFKPYQEEKGFTPWLNGNNSRAFRWVPENVRVLDIGCGFGESLGYHSARGCEVHGVDADENILRIADKYNFNAQAGLFSPDNYEKEYFDYVTLDQVIEHAENPQELLDDINTVVKKNGVVILGTPNVKSWGKILFGKYWINWHVPYHMHFFSIKSIQQLADQSGFKLEYYKTITPSAWLHFQWLHLLFYPGESFRSKFWSMDKSVSKKEKYFRIFINLVNKMKINHLITRLFDALGYGDNIIFILRKNG